MRTVEHWLGSGGVTNAIFYAYYFTIESNLADRGEMNKAKRSAKQLRSNVMTECFSLLSMLLLVFVASIAGKS